MIDSQAPVIAFDEIDSTMLEARRRAEARELDAVWLVARRQTAGRGRRGRSWASIDGNLLVTYLFTTTRPTAEIALIGFATAVAIAECIEALAGPGRVTLKWPNDVLIDGAKAAGVMLDSGSLGGHGAWVALGFGVNLIGAPDNLDQPTMSVQTLLGGAPPGLEPMAFLAPLMTRLAAWDRSLSLEGFEPLRQAWLARAHGLGQEARVMQGERALEGRIAGISPRGELELDTVDGRRFIAAGDVLLPNSA
ncbi:MAG: biotin--[acetyl-CoA-carboxylase] ligase [Hyphomonadaceae bacterium]